MYKSKAWLRYIPRYAKGFLDDLETSAVVIECGKRRVAIISVDVCSKTIRVPANVPKPEDLPLARKYNELHEAGLDHEIPYEAMELTTVVAEAARMCALANGPEFFELELTGIRLGEIAMVGIPGEPFTEISMKIKDTEGWRAYYRRLKEIA